MFMHEGAEIAADGDDVQLLGQLGLVVRDWQRLAGRGHRDIDGHVAAGLRHCCQRGADLGLTFWQRVDALQRGGERSHWHGGQHRNGGGMCDELAHQLSRQADETSSIRGAVPFLPIHRGKLAALSGPFMTKYVNRAEPRARALDFAA